MPSAQFWKDYESQAQIKLMGTSQLLEMANYLSVPRTFKDISAHLALSTFSDEEVQVVFTGLLEPDGNVHEVGHFGYTESDCVGPVTIPVRHNTPIRSVLKSGNAFVYQNRPELFEEFVDGYKYPVPPTWKTLAIFPISDFGIVAIFFRNEIEDNPDIRLHLQTLGALIGLQMKCNKNVDQIDFINDNQFPTQSNSSMSERQVVILKMIERGLTNSEIAKEVGYSESLVRQETVHIFRKLNVSGRKEILNHSNGVPENSNHHKISKP